MIKRKIGIVGAGPAGLAVLKAVLDSPQYKSGLWDDPVAFEAKDNVGGVWCKYPESIGLGMQSPIYDSLTTNLPYPVMAFSSFNFPPDTPLYPSAEVAQTYLEAFADQFDLRKFIIFNTKVICADWSDKNNGGKWTISTAVPKDLSTIEKNRHEFDLLMVCNGHYSEPRYPSTPGLDSWVSAGHALHSVDYRNPSSIQIPSKSADTPLNQHLKDANILVIGGGPSGSDISAELVPLAKRVFHSFSPTSAASRAVDAPPQTKAASEEPRLLSPSVANPIPKPRVKCFSQITSSQSERSVYFEDGTVEHNVDYCMLATGYKFSYPFFDASPDADPSSPEFNTQRAFTMTHDLIPPTPCTDSSNSPSTALPSALFNTSFGVFPLASHLFGIPGSGFSSSISNPCNDANNGLPPPTNIAFLGLPIRVAPLPLVEAQARAAVAAFAFHDSRDNHSDDGVDWKFEVELLNERWNLLTKGWEESNKNHEWKDDDEKELSLRTYLSKEWHRFERENIQFEYRDRMHELACRLQSQMNCSSTSSSLDGTPLANFRVRHWEPEMYSLKVVLRRAWVAWAKTYSDGNGGISEDGVKLRKEWSRFEDGKDEDGARGEPGDTVRFMRGLLRWCKDASRQEMSS